MYSRFACLYYSRTGQTKELMARLALLLGADLIEYSDGKERKGAFGYLRSAIDSYRKPPVVQIESLDRPLSSYEAVIIGMPVWAEMPCIVGKGLLAQYETRFPHTRYLLLTHMAKATYEKAIERLEETFFPFRRTLSVCTKEPVENRLLEDFAEKIRKDLEKKPKIETADENIHTEEKEKNS